MRNEERNEKRENTRETRKRNEKRETSETNEKREKINDERGKGTRNEKREKETRNCKLWNSVSGSVLALLYYGFACFLYRFGGALGAPLRCQTPVIQMFLCFRAPDSILEKLRNFHHTHETPIDQLLADLETAVGQLPYNTRNREAELVAEVLREHAHRRAGVTTIGALLPAVLARLGIHSTNENKNRDRP